MLWSKGWPLGKPVTTHFILWTQTLLAVGVSLHLSGLDLRTNVELRFFDKYAYSLKIFYFLLAVFLCVFVFLSDKLIHDIGMCHVFSWLEFPNWTCYNLSHAMQIVYECSSSAKVHEIRESTLDSAISRWSDTDIDSQAMMNWMKCQVFILGHKKMIWLFIPMSQFSPQQDALSAVGQIGPTDTDTVNIWMHRSWIVCVGFSCPEQNRPGSGFLVPNGIDQVRVFLSWTE